LLQVVLGQRRRAAGDGGAIAGGADRGAGCQRVAAGFCFPAVGLHALTEFGDQLDRPEPEFRAFLELEHARLHAGAGQ
jgi:hypothetical protein